MKYIIRVALTIAIALALVPKFENKSQFHSPSELRADHRKIKSEAYEAP